jgi:N utilization substance protein A
MAHARNEFALALNQICEERGITPESVIETIKTAILAAFRKENSANKNPVVIEEYTAEINAETGEAKILDKDGKDVTPPGFGRIAAQTAKQVILQKIRESEKQAVLTDYATKVGALTNGLILRFDHSNAIVDIGKTEAVMPPSEQIYSERYKVNQRLVFYLVGIKDGPKGQVVIVSRAHSGLIEGLFRREIPEVQNNTVKIKEIVREPGVRTKVAVLTDKSGVDPIGACVGQKGVRVQAVLKEIPQSERIDLVLFSENIEEYLRSALAPAKELRIALDEANKIAKVYCPEEQLSLAIGSKGSNVGLASRLIGWKVEIVSADKKEEEKREIGEIGEIGEIKKDKKKEVGEVKKEEVKPKKKNKSQEAKKEKPKKEKKAKKKES